MGQQFIFTHSFFAALRDLKLTCFVSAFQSFSGHCHLPDQVENSFYNFQSILYCRRKYFCNGGYFKLRVNSISYSPFIICRTKSWCQSEFMVSL
jgi:hypothetical protein